MAHSKMPIQRSEGISQAGARSSSILSLFRKYFVALRTERNFVQGEKRHNLQTLQMERECKVKRQIKVQ